MTDQELRDALEALLDKTSAYRVLDALETISYEKAEHIQANWQDSALAKAWTRIGNTVSQARHSVSKVGI